MTNLSQQVEVIQACYEVRQVPERPWVWQVWDVEHPAVCNHFPVLTVDSNGASDDFHEEMARLCAEALNRRFMTAVGPADAPQLPQGKQGHG
jgi:hypothetical protein